MQRSALTDKITAIVAPSAESMGYALVQVRLFEHGKGRTLQIMAEHKDGSVMTVDDCARISRTVSALLDVEDPIPGAYSLEVSSPGIDRPLVSLRDFTTYAGHEVKIETALPVEGRKRFKGTLVGAEQENITVKMPDLPGGRASIAFANIHSAKLVLTDELVRQYLRQHKQSS